MATIQSYRGLSLLAGGDTGCERIMAALRALSDRVFGPTVTKTANYTITEAEAKVLVNASAGAVTLTLPDAATAYQPVLVKPIAATSNAVLVQRAGSALIDPTPGANVPSVVITAPTTFWSDGTNWHTLVYGGGAGALGVYAVTAFGAKGDSASDDAAAINAAVTAANAGGGGEVLVPRGNYLVQSSIALRSNVRLRGMPGAKITMGASIPGTNAAASAGVNLNAVANAGIVGLEIDGNKAAFAGATEFRHCVFVDGSTNVTLRDLYLHDAKGDGLFIGTTANANLHAENVRCSANYRQGMSALYLERARFVGCTFENTSGTAPQAGVDLEPSAGDTIDQVVFEACHFNGNAGYGVAVSGASGGTFGAVTITGCFLKSNTQDGVWVNGTGAAARIVVEGNQAEANGATEAAAQYATNNASNVVIKGNTARGGAGRGVSVAGLGSHVTVEGNTVLAPGSRGILVAETGQGNPSHVAVRGNTVNEAGTRGIELRFASDCVVEGNKVTASSQSAATTYENVYVSASSARVLVKGNQVRQGSLANKPNYGIRFASGVTDCAYGRNDVYDAAATQWVLNSGTRTRFPDGFHAVDFGVKADGSTDDRAAIQSAIDAANAAGGGVVVLPAGTIMVTPAGTATFITAKASVTLRGQGPGATRIKATAGASYRQMFKDASGTPAHNFRLENLTVDQNSANAAAVTTADGQQQYGLLFNYSAGVKIRNTRWENVHAINTIVGNGEGCTDWEIADNYIEWVPKTVPVTYDNSVMYLEMKRYTVTRNVLKTAVGNGARSGIEVHGNHGVCTNNQIAGFRTGINVVDTFHTNGDLDTGHVVSLNTITACNTGIALWPSTHRTGTAQAGGATTITLDAGANASDDFYVNWYVRTTGGTGAGQTKKIVDYVGATKVATVESAWSVNPDNTTTFKVFRVMRNVSVVGNTIDVQQVTHRAGAYEATGGANTVSDGIWTVWNNGQSSEVEGLVIKGNTISFEDEGAGSAEFAENLNCGISPQPYGAEARGVVVEGNTVIRAPGAGIRCSGSVAGSHMKAARFSGNVLIDCGQNVGITNTAFRCAINVEQDMTGVVVENNAVHDSGRTVAISAIGTGGTTTVTVDTAQDHGWVTGQQVTIAGCTPSGYNGTFTITRVDANTFTYAVGADPGTATVIGTATGLRGTNAIIRYAGGTLSNVFVRNNQVVSASGITLPNNSLAAAGVSTGMDSAGSDRGDASVTLVAGVDNEVQRFATALTANRTVTLSSTNAYNGRKFRVVRTGLGAFTLDVGGLKTIPASTAAFVEVMHDGAAWRLTGYGTL